MSVVKEFYERMGESIPFGPPLQVEQDLIRHRMRMIREEFEEVMEELKELAHPLPPDATVKRLRMLLKELADLRYVVEGTAVLLGLPFEEAYAEVHRSNMTKSINPDGRKAVKGEHYVPANMGMLIPDIITVEGGPYGSH